MLISCFVFVTMQICNCVFAQEGTKISHDTAYFVEDEQQRKKRLTFRPDYVFVRDSELTLLCSVHISELFSIDLSSSAQHIL